MCQFFPCPASAQGRPQVTGAQPPAGPGHSAQAGPGGCPRTRPPAGGHYRGPSIPLTGQFSPVFYRTFQSRKCDPAADLCPYLVFVHKLPSTGLRGVSRPGWRTSLDRRESRPCPSWAPLSTELAWDTGRGAVTVFPKTGLLGVFWILAGGQAHSCPVSILGPHPGGEPVPWSLRLLACKGGCPG